MRRPSWSVTAVFLLVALMLSFVEARPAFPDPDSFYHAKMALEIRDHGFIHAFPWLQETALRDSYVDGHWLYHVLLIPFVTIFNPLVGIKVSAVLFGLAAFYALYRLLKSIASPYPEWLTLVAALSFDFLQRMSLPKAGSLSVALLLFLVWAMLQRRPKIVFAASVLYVWLYQGWPVVLIALGCVVIGGLVSRHFFGAKFDERRTAFALTAGLATGLTVNPYFPQNVGFVFDLVTNIVVFGKTDIPVGAEWYPIQWLAMFKSEMLALTAFGLASASIIPAGATGRFDLSPRKTRTTFALLLLMAVFGALTFRSIRYMEYSVPFLILTTGSLLAIVEPFIRHEIMPSVRSFHLRRPRTAIMALVIASIAVGCLAFESVEYGIPTNGYYSASQYEGSARWMRRYLPRDEIVFNALWDTSLAYFYLDDSHYFLVGLDPRLMRDADGTRYHTWFDLQSGKDADVSRVKTVFHASAVLVDRRLKGDFVKNLEASGLFEKTYEDEWTQVYILR